MSILKHGRGREPANNTVSKLESHPFSMPYQTYDHYKTFHPNNGTMIVHAEAAGQLVYQSFMNL